MNLRKFCTTARRGSVNSLFIKSTVFGESYNEGGALMYAVIQTGGKQYRVAEGDILNVEKLDVEAGKEVVFDQVLTVVNDSDVKIGKPVVKGAKVTANVLEHGKGKKIFVFKYKAKANYRKRQGHRQPYTQLRIKSIEA